MLKALLKLVSLLGFLTLSDLVWDNRFYCNINKRHLKFIKASNTTLYSWWCEELDVLRTNIETCVLQNFVSCPREFATIYRNLILINFGVTNTFFYPTGKPWTMSQLSLKLSVPFSDISIYSKQAKIR